MSLDIRVMRESDRDAFVALRRGTFWLTPAALQASWDIPAQEVLLAVDDGRVVGSIRAERVGQMVQGGSVSCGLVTAVAVEPGNRGAGVGQALLAAAFDRMREQSVAITTLHASTPAPYRRAGYEIAGVRSRWRIPVGLLGRTESDYRVVRAEPQDPAIREAYRRFASRHDGLLDRSDAWWDTRVLAGAGDTPLECFLALDASGSVAGYVLISRPPRAGVDPNEPDFGFDLVCRDLVWLDVEAAKAFIAFFRGYRAVADVLHWPGPPLDPMATLLADHAAEPEPSFTYMSRIVSIQEAVGQRSWPTSVEADVRLRVLDPQIPGNDGCCRIRVHGGHGRAEPVTEADATIDIGALSALYGGGLSVASAVALGRLSGQSEGTLSDLARVFPPSSPWVMDAF